MTFGRQIPKIAQLAPACHESHPGLTKTDGNQTHEGPCPKPVLWSVDWQG